MIFTILLRKKNILYKKYSIYPLLLVIILCIAKIFIVVEFPFTINFDSTTVMPTLRRILNNTAFSFNLWNINFNISVFSTLIIFSLMTSVVIAFKKFYDNLKFYRLINSLTEINDKNLTEILLNVQSISNINKKIKIVVHNKIPYPSIIGYFKPVIALPELNFSDYEIKGILTHELMHYKHNHLIIKFFIEILKILFWWNPLTYIFSHEVNNILEFYADKKLSMLLDREEQKHYLCGIKKVVDNYEYQRKIKPSYISIGLTENVDNIVLIQRCKLIAENAYKKSSKIKSAVLSAVIIFLFLLSYMFVIQPCSEPAEEYYNDGAPICLDGNFFIIADEKEYRLYDANTNEFFYKIPRFSKLYDADWNEILLKPGSVSNTYSSINFYYYGEFTISNELEGE